MNWYILVIDKRNFQSSEERNEISYQMIDRPKRLASAIQSNDE